MPTLGLVKPWLAYSLIRVGVFAVVLLLLTLTGVQLWLAAIVAAVIGLCVAYIFFGGLRDSIARDLAQRRSGATRPDVDAAAEDSAAEDARS